MHLIFRDTIPKTHSRSLTCFRENGRLFSEAVAQRCSVKKVFLEISQNSQENTYARVSFLITLRGNFIEKRLWHRCFPVNLAKFLRTPFFKEHLRYLLLFFACISLKREGCFCGKIFVHMSRFGSTKYSLRLSI